MSATAVSPGLTRQTILASAARTTAQTGADLAVPFGTQGLIVILNVTAASGTGGLQVEIQGKDPLSAAYFRLLNLPAAVIATGTTAYELGRGLAGNAGGGVIQSNGGLIPDTIRVNVAVGDATSNTYSLSLQFV